MSDAFDPQTWGYRPEEQQSLQKEALVCNAIILIAITAYCLQWLPWWLLYLILNITLVRWMLAVHELFHVFSHDKANRWLRLLLIPFTPINVGYHEFRQLHYGHHQYNAAPPDPDAFHIRGGHAKSLLGALTFPERCSWHYWRETQGKTHWFELLLRLGLFSAFAYWGGLAFFAAWLALRLNYAVAIWVFFHHLHYRDGDYGVFPLPLPRWLQAPLVLAYGKNAVEATMHHDVHHRWPWIAANRLQAAREQGNQ